jgi:xylulokinase
VIGGLSQIASDELGLPQGTAVTTGTGDLHSAAVGSGAVADYAAHLYMGTSSWISCHVPFKKTDALRNVASVPSGLPGRYLVADEHETGGVCLTFLRDKVLYPDDGLGDLGCSPPEDFLDRCNTVAARVPAGAHGVLFTPWLNGERCPVDDHTIRGGFHNMSLATDRSDMVRAVFEGVALNSRWLLGAVEHFVGRRLDPLAFIGGGANSQLWAQMHADALDRRVRRMKDPVLANARGAGLLALLALGLVRVPDIGSMVEAEGDYVPDPATAVVYRELGKEFVRLYKRTKGIHRRLNR